VSLSAGSSGSDPLRVLVGSVDEGVDGLIINLLVGEEGKVSEKFAWEER
jgi:hypothetical protein